MGENIFTERQVTHTTHSGHLVLVDPSIALAKRLPWIGPEKPVLGHTSATRKRVSFDGTPGHTRLSVVLVYAGLISVPVHYEIGRSDNNGA